MNETPPMDDRVDTEAKGPVIEKAASDQLARQRVKVDRYAIEPKTAASQP